MNVPRPIAAKHLLGIGLSVEAEFIFYYIIAGRFVRLAQFRKQREISRTAKVYIFKSVPVAQCRKKAAAFCISNFLQI